MKKITIWIIMIGLVCFVGCASELVFVQNKALYRVKDNGSGLSPIVVDPPQNVHYTQPEVSPDAEHIAFICTSSIAVRGDICTAKLDGTNSKKIATGPWKMFPRWSQDGHVAYYDWVTHNIDRYDVTTGTSANLFTCPTVCFGGFDIYDGGNRLVYSLDVSGGSIWQLWVKNLSTGSTIPIPPLPPTGIPSGSVVETQPVVSFDGKMLASRVEWPGFEGIRMRAMDSSGNWGGPFTMNLSVYNVTGISFSHDDEKLYFTARSVTSPTAPMRLHSVGLRELMQGILSAMTGPLPPVQNVTPTSFYTEGSPTDLLSWPSGINK
jgi:hypothetical protein